MQGMKKNKKACDHGQISFLCKYYFFYEVIENYILRIIYKLHDLLHVFLQCDVPEGGMVPKTWYMRDDETEKDRSPGEHTFNSDSIYHTAHVVKEFPHEV
jgi:hypothetical protein